jgi:hypothetical protein
MRRIVRYCVRAVDAGRYHTPPRRLGIELLAKAFPKQGNQFGYVILKGRNLLPWLSEDSNGNVVVSKDVVERMGRIYKRVD